MTIKSLFKNISIFIILLFSISYVTADLTDSNTILYLDLDTNSSTQYDSSLSLNNGTVTSATYTNSGKLRGGYNFSIGTDTINTGTGTGASYAFGTSDLSFNFWVYPKDRSNIYRLLSKHDCAFSAGAGFDFNVDTSGYVLFFRSSGTAPDIQKTSSTLPINQWTMLTVNIDYGNNIKIYFNGTEQPYSSTFSNWGTFTNANNLHIGSNSGACGNSNALIDEVLIRKGYTLNSTEISELYNSYTGYNPFYTGIFELTASNAYNSTTIYNFSANIDNGTYNQTFFITNGSINWERNQLINITIYNISTYFNKTYTNYNTSVDLNAEIIPYFYNHNDVHYSNYTLYDTTNYVRNLVYTYNVTCRNGTNTYVSRYVNDSFISSELISCYNTKHEYTGYYSHDSEINTSYSMRVVNIDGNSSIDGINLSWDIYNPVISYLNFTIPDYFNTTANITMICYDNVSPVLNYNISFNSALIFNGTLDNGTTQSNLSSIITGTNSLYGVCKDFFSVTDETLSIYSYLSYLFLIDEKDATDFNLDNVTSARVYYSDTNYFDFKDEGTSSVNFTTLSDPQLRFSFEYDSGEVITRYIDLSVINSTDIRICINKEGTTHYEQEIIASSEQPVILTSSFANCYIAADYTRFAYQDAYLLKAYTIETLYYLYTFTDDIQTLLASLDGSKSTYINLDTLEFKKTSYNINVLGDGFSFKMNGNSSLTIYYENLANDSLSASIRIIDLSTSDVVLPSTDLETPNNFVLYFDYTTLNVTNKTLYQLELTKSTYSETTTIKRYFNPNAQSGIITSGLAATIGMILIFFGLTFTSSKLTFSWFGIMIELIALAIFSLAIAEWYIIFLSFIDFIAIIYSFIILTSKNYPTVA